MTEEEFLRKIRKLVSQRKLHFKDPEAMTKLALEVRDLALAYFNSAE